MDSDHAAKCVRCCCGGYGLDVVVFFIAAQIMKVSGGLLRHLYDV